jgi:hypothetical protein
MRANAAGAVYGTIAVAALLDAENANQETYLATEGAVLLTMLLYWLAHSYAELAGGRLQTGESLTLPGLWRTMAHEFTILVGAALPLFVLLFCWIAGASLATGIKAAVWTSAATIVAFEIAIGIHLDLKGRELLGQVAVGLVLGLGVIALQLLLH